jgi:hypothetical protein
LQSGLSVLGLGSGSGVCGSLLSDLRSARKTMADSHLAELVNAAKRYNVKAPVCDAVLTSVHTLEQAVAGAGEADEAVRSLLVGIAEDKQAQDHAHSQSQEQQPLLLQKAFVARMHAIDSAYDAALKASQETAYLSAHFPLTAVVFGVELSHPSVRECCYWSVRYSGYVTLLAALIFLFYEYELE